MRETDMADLSATHTGRVELQGKTALASVATLLGVAFGLSTVVTPLYLLYQQKFGFSQITLTLIYATYVVGNVGALLFFGHLSDTVGRRPAALAAIAVLIAATFSFLFANGTAMLYVARVLSGLGVGIASGTANAWLAELAGGDKARAATIGTSSNFLGLGIAALASGLLAQYAPWPLHLSFVIYLVVICAVAILIRFSLETVHQPDWDRLTFRPMVSLPRKNRAQFVAPAITGFGLMALVGFYASLMPSILSHDLHIKSHAAAGALLFELAIVVVFVIVATRSLESRLAMLWSLGLIIPAAAAAVIAQVAASLWVMLVATCVVGVSTGLGYRGSLQVVNQIAPEDERAAVVSSYFICCFIGNALPVIGVGVLSTLTSMTVADIAFACTIAAFAAVALIFGLKERRR
jgi:MFS family permease